MDAGRVRMSPSQTYPGHSFPQLLGYGLGSMGECNCGRADLMALGA
jgi:hypothetical protein